MPRLLTWLEQRRPDVVCLQETKLGDSAFHELFDAPLADLGYRVAHHGHGGFNGVALLSRVGLDDVEADFRGQPQYDGVTEARALSATCDGVRIHSLYVPNGREVGSPHYLYKLAWLDALAAVVADGPADVALCGDINIAPPTSTSSTRQPSSATPTSPSRNGSASRTSGWSTWCAPAGRSTRRCTPTGITGRACSIRTTGCAST
nr:exodeoxyribonuclease III [Tessaracoccus coleopterorum]